MGVPPRGRRPGGRTCREGSHSVRCTGSWPTSGQWGSPAAPLRRRLVPPCAAPPPGAAPRDPGLVTGAGGGAEGKPARSPREGPVPPSPARCGARLCAVRASPRVRAGAGAGVGAEPGRARWAPPAMDHKPLLQERPPAYNLEAGQGDFACGPHGYGAIPAAPPPPPYPYLVTGGPRGAAGRAWGASRAPGAEVAGRGDDPGGGPGRGRGRAERAGHGALGAACKLGVSPMATFNPETNFTPDAAAAGRCREADSGPRGRSPWGRVGGQSSRTWKLLSGSCSWRYSSTLSSPRGCARQARLSRDAAKPRFKLTLLMMSCLHFST